MILTQQQIDKRVVTKIRQRYSIDDEQKLSRMAHGQTMGIYTLDAVDNQNIVDYNDYILQCLAWGKQAKIDSDKEQATLDYDNAVIRLARPIKEFGRPEKIVPPVLDEFDNVVEEGYTIKAIEPIEPLMLTRDVYEAGSDIWAGTEEYLNPIIEEDRQSRADAQAIVDAGLPV